MIEHRGRKSGQRFRTVIEVAGRNPESNEWIVCAGWGPKSDWYLNLRAGNLEAVWLASHRYRDATIRFLDNKEAGQVIARYEEAHPKAAKVLFRGMGVAHDGSYEGRAEMMKSLPMVAFKV